MRTYVWMIVCLFCATAHANTPVIVVGAGIAGIAAARTLRDAGRAVIVLEARDRIGGRIWTDHSNGLPLDMGASWIHGTTNNPLSQMARSAGLTLIPTNYAARLVLSGAQVLDRAALQRLDTLTEQLEQFVHRVQAQLTGDQSLADTATQFATERALPAEQIAWLDHILTSEYELEYGLDSAQLSIRHMGADSALGGGDAMIAGGYQQLVNRLATGLDIRTAHVVQHIDYRSAPVTLHTSRGIFTASTVIVTVPLGVLKRGSIAFTPPLPGPKRAAIQHLHMGTLEKVFVQFPRMFWDAKIHRIGRITERHGQFSEIYNLAPVLGQPVLMALHAGSVAQQFETVATPARCDQLTAHLRTLYGPTVPNPTSCATTRWNDDSYAAGAYSALGLGATPADYDALAAPVGTALHFAGEATHREYPSTAHGAYLSGIRAAKEVLRGR